MKLTEYNRITFFFYKPKTHWNPDILNLFSEIFNFRLYMYFTENIELGHDYGVTLTSYFGFWYLF